MNEIFSFHKELNIKKIIFIITFFIFIIGISIFVFSKKSNIIISKNNSPYITFYGTNNSISLNLLKKYELTQSESNKYIIELHSPKNLHILISHESLINDRNLSDVANADIKAYIEEFNSYSNLSELKEFEINGNLSYTYSFHYLDTTTKTTYYLQVIWLQENDGYYIFDISFPLDDLNTYSNIINETLDNFKIEK